MAWPSEAGILGIIQPRRIGRPGVRPVRRRGIIVAPPLGRSRYHQRFIGLWRAYNAAVYRIYMTLGSPPVAGSTPTLTTATLPRTVPGAFADGVWYLSVSWFNGVLDSGFLPIGPAGETYIRFDFAGGVPIQSPPRAPVSFRGE